MNEYVFQFKRRELLSILNPRISRNDVDFMFNECVSSEPDDDDTAISVNIVFDSFEKAFRVDREQTIKNFLNDLPSVGSLWLGNHHRLDDMSTWQDAGVNDGANLYLKNKTRDDVREEILAVMNDFADYVFKEFQNNGDLEEYLKEEVGLRWTNIEEEKDLSYSLSFEGKPCTYIPDSFGNLQVDIVSFRECESLTSVVVPDSVTSIVQHAFYGCMNLTAVTLPHNVTEIGDYAFYECTSLASIYIPNNVNSIGFGSFNGCRKLSSITIPDTISHIRRDAFSRCLTLRNVTIRQTTDSLSLREFERIRGMLLMKCGLSQRTRVVYA